MPDIHLRQSFTVTFTTTQQMILAARVPPEVQEG